MAQTRDGRPLFWSGLIAAAFAALIAAFGAHTGSLAGVQRALGSEVEEALARTGLGHVRVDMSGQRAVLSGVVARAELVEEARATAAAAAGPGGRWAGGVTSVDVSALEVGPQVAPFTWEIERRGGQVVLRGYAPSSLARSALAQAAQERFASLEVRDEMQVAGGAPDGPWAQVALDAVAQLARLERGGARLTDGRLVILGEGAAGDVAAVREHYAAALPQPFSVRLEVIVEGEAIPIEELGGLDLSEGSAEACQEAFARLMRRNVITFETGSARVDASSLALLSHLASVALRCDAFMIEVSGHTDSVGSRVLNMDLSLRRAEAVLDYLKSQGVRPARLQAQGYGPDRPRASNATPAGQAANRRIEFEVKPAQPQAG
jgi:OOP family OmpA-OmpF porin